MAWCHQATSHYLSQCWPRSICHLSSLGHNELIDNIWVTQLSHILFWSFRLVFPLYSICYCLPISVAPVLTSYNNERELINSMPSTDNTFRYTMGKYLDQSLSVLIYEEKQHNPGSTIHNKIINLYLYIYIVLQINIFFSYPIQKLA